MRPEIRNNLLRYSSHSQLQFQWFSPNTTVVLESQSSLAGLPDSSCETV